MMFKVAQLTPKTPIFLFKMFCQTVVPGDNNSMMNILVPPKGQHNKKKNVMVAIETGFLMRKSDGWVKMRFYK